MDLEGIGKPLIGGPIVLLVLGLVMPSSLEFPRKDEAVEKVGVGPLNDLESSSERPKVGVSGLRSGISKGHEGVFNRLAPSRQLGE